MNLSVDWSGTFRCVTENQSKLRYEIVKDMILTIISEQRLQPGDRLPTSTELAEQSGFSLISVRRALDELERAGRIQRQQGVGTFVAQNRIVSSPARTGELLETLGGADQGTKLTTQLVSIKAAVPSATIAANLRLAEGLPVWEVVRRRMLNGKPMIAETAVIPLQLAPTLDEDWLRAGKSLYGFLATKYGLIDQHEEQFLEVTVPSAHERSQLDLPTRENIVRVRGVSYSEDGTPFDCFQQIYPARQFVFFVSGSQQKHLLPSANPSDWSVTPLTKG